MKRSKIHHLTLVDLLTKLNKLLITPEYIFVIDENVCRLYSAALSPIINSGRCWISRPGESCKSFKELENSLEFFLKNGVTRNHQMIAIGGGATSDFAGTVASLLLRGISWSIVPTTLLSMVDASIGGKVAINSEVGKNLIGSFHLPDNIWICSNFLETLPMEEIASGKGELLKYGLLDKKINDQINSSCPISELLKSCSELKNDIIQKDLFEKADRVFLNLGHSIGHAIEKISGIPHGIAVILGIKKINEIYPYNGCKEDVDNLLDKLQVDISIYNNINCSSQDILKYLIKDKKVFTGNSIRLVLLKQIGSPYIKEVQFQELENRL